MTLTQLEYIIAIQKYGSFRKAAGQLFVSQSTVSSQVRKLEKELGTDIFDRSGPVIRLTQAGAKLLYLSEPMMHLKEEIEKSCSEKEKFRLIIYSIYLPIATRCFAEYIAGLGISEYDVGFIETNMKEILSSVINYTSDVGLILTNEYNLGLMEEVAAKEHLVLRQIYSARPQVYLSADHPLAKKEEIDPEELNGYPYLCFDLNARLLPLAMDIGPVSEPGFRKSIFVSDRLSARTILRLNQAYCIGVGKRAGFDDLLSSSDGMIRAVPLREDGDLQIQAVYHEDALSGAAEEFLDLLAKEMATE